MYISAISLILILLSFSIANSFHVIPCSSSTQRMYNTQLFLKDDVAEMVDRALYYQLHKKEMKHKWEENNHKVLEPSLPQSYDAGDYFNAMNDDDDEGKMIQKRKDRRLASKNPERYCADRCVTTGSCDIFEEMFDMSPQEVMAFCDECILSEEEEPCTVPPKFLDENFDSSIRP